jgi:hypothetical protein
LAYCRIEKNYPVFWEGKGNGIPQLEKKMKKEIKNFTGIPFPQ